MRLHHLLALPSSALLLAALAGCATAAPAAPVPTPTATRSATPVVTVAPDAVCGTAATLAVAKAKQGSAPFASLGGSTLTAKAAAAGAKAIALPSGTLTLHDFLAGDERIDAARIPAASAGLVGAGVDRSTITLSPHSSTRKSRVPTVEYEVNPLNAVRVSGAHAVVGDLTLLGTPQGHTYNGLRIERSTDPRIANVKVVGIPGDMDRPPGETFGINDYKTVGARYDHVEVDGAGVGAAGFAANGSQDISVCDASSHDNKVSMGFAFWHVKNITMIDCTAVRNGFTGFNFERVSGTVKLVRPVAQDNRWDMRVASDQGSATYTVIDPDMTHTQVPGTWTVELPSTYYKHPSLQKRSQIHLIVDGKERPDLLRFVQPY
jgi:hypothetical protein